MGIFLLVTSVQSKINANLSRALLVSLPASILGTVGAGGFTRILMMSYDACIRKSSNFTAVKSIFLGGKTTVSAFTSALVV